MSDEERRQLAHHRICLLGLAGRQALKQALTKERARGSFTVVQDRAGVRIERES